MSLQELCNRYKDEICPYCTKQGECNICKTVDGVKCCEYKKIRKMKIH